MKKIVFILSFIFFFTQIVPVKYISYWGNYKMCVESNDLTENDDDNDDAFKLKEKGFNEFVENHFTDNTIALNTLKKVNNKFPSFCCLIPSDFIKTILIPPPNC